MAGSSRSQPWIAAAERFIPGPRSGGGRPARRPKSLAIGPQNAIGFRLRVLHRLLRRLGARERRLQTVVEGLGDALVLMRRKLGHSELELIARDSRLRE